MNGCPATAFDTDTTCTECGNSVFDHGEDGAWYCQECGMVCSLTPVEYSEPGWRPSDEQRSGPSTSQTRVNKGTKIGNFGETNRPQWVKFNNRLQQQTETLHHGLKEVRAVAAALELPEATREHAGYLFRRAADAGHLQGQSIEAVAAASVCAGGKEFGPHLTFTWVAEVSPVEKSRITTAYRKLVSEFNLPIEPMTPVGILPRIADRVDSPVDIRRRARNILHEVEAANAHIGQSPPGLAAAAIYHTDQIEDGGLTQAEIAAAAGVSEGTLSRQWNRISGLDCDNENRI